MDRVKFREHLIEGTEFLLSVTREKCFNNISSNVQYIIVPNSRTVAENDEHLTEEERSVLINWNTFKDEALSGEEVVQLLHHNNRVPVWIDMCVIEARKKMTLIELFLSRRLRSEEELMHQGLHPFSFKVTIPGDERYIRKDGKIDVNWEIKKRNRLINRIRRYFNPPIN